MVRVHNLDTGFFTNKTLQEKQNADLCKRSCPIKAEAMLSKIRQDREAILRAILSRIPDKLALSVA
ncbi:hypothetical protein J6590_054476 [Homalodisca vitripennis]|nr:hypothetical protein J6590_054476 [Homalodisca vitripennis]